MRHAMSATAVSRRSRRPNAAQCWPVRLRHDAAPGAAVLAGAPPARRVSRRRGHASRVAVLRASGTTMRGGCLRASGTTSREGGHDLTAPAIHYEPGHLARLLGLPEPTTEQAEVIAAPLEPLAVIAGAGSGKSETMAARLVW